MNRPTPIHWFAMLAVAACGGCAVLQPVSTLPAKKLTGGESPTAQRQSRREELVRQFEERRDQAQLSAALDRWKQGDAAGCETLLVQLLQRRPDCREARHLLADLYAARPDAAAAQEELTRLLADFPSDARAHHSLGLLLESLDRPSEALSHFEQAASLEPANKLYSHSRDACRETE
jgi:Tfp pilus assembly protein PilF